MTLAFSFNLKHGSYRERDTQKAKPPERAEARSRQILTTSIEAHQVYLSLDNNDWIPTQNLSGFG